MVLRWLSFFLASIIFLSSCSRDLIYFPGTVEEEVQKSLDQGFDGIIVYVDKAGVVSKYSAGFKDKASNTPMDTNSLFKIASISKLYMAVAAAKLINLDSLSMNDKLSDLIPEVKGRIEYADQITLAMMIRHRSGVPEYIYHPDFSNEDPDKPYLETVALIYDKEADFEPGSDYAYSNTNYLLLGEIMNRALGYSHHEYITNEILAPLGLTQTYNLYDEKDSLEMCSGYYAGYDDDFKRELHTRPGGSMVSTAEEVGIFVKALVKGNILSKEEQELYSSLYRYEHTGWLNGYTSIVRYHPDIDAVVVQFINTSKNSFYWVKLERTYNRIVKAVENEN